MSGYLIAFIVFLITISCSVLVVVFSNMLKNIYEEINIERKNNFLEEIKALKKEIEKLENENSDLMEINEKLSSALENTRNNFSSTITYLHDQIDFYKAQVLGKSQTGYLK